MGTAASTPTSDATPRRPSLGRSNTGLSSLRLTSRTSGVTSRRIPGGGRARVELPPNGAPTDPQDWPFIESCLCRLALFSGPAGPAVAAAAARATWVLSLDPGEIVARGGDAGTHDATAELYVVADGELELLAPRGGDSLARVALKRRGDADGEGALVGGVPRRATLAAATRARVWVLSRPAFRAAAAAARTSGGGGAVGLAPSSAAGAAVFLSDGVPLLAPLGAAERAAVGRAAVVARHPPGAVVLAAGDPVAGLLVVWEGEAALVAPHGGAGGGAAAARLFSGDTVGADALLGAAPGAAKHTASVLATTHLTTLTVGAAAFAAAAAPALRAAAAGGGPPRAGASTSPTVAPAAAAATKADIRIKTRRPDGTWAVTRATGRGDDARALGATPRAPGGRPTLTLVDGPPLGAGAFSRVTLATDPATGRRFALKRMLKTAVAPCPEHVWAERAVARGAVHPFCVRTYAAFQSARHLYLLSDALPGGDLMDVLARDARVVRAVRPGAAAALAAAVAPRCGGRPPPRVLRGLDEHVARFYAGCVVLALAHLHGRGVVYRDLKPENVLIAADGYGRLGDFGFAKAVGVGGRTHTFCGTPGYVAPENVLAAGYGASVDWWGLGVVVYVLLTGRQPFAAPRSDDPMVVMRRIVDAGWRVPFPPYVSKHARGVVSALLARDPARRLGCGPGGAADVMAHPWFAGLDWDALAARRLPCPRPPRDDAAKRLAELADRAARGKGVGGDGDGDAVSEAEQADADALFADF